MRSMRIRGDKIDSSPNPHETEDAIIQALEDEKECRRLTVQMEKKKKYLLDQLDGLQNQLHITILRGYYVDDKTFNEIGIELKRSGKSVRSNYKKALNEFEKKYGKEYLKSTTTHL